MIAIKTIKFDLPIDGVKVKNIDELRDHFTVEILDLYHNGLLVRWLQSRKLDDELIAIQNIQDSSDRFILMKHLCFIFKVEADDILISLSLDELLGKDEKELLNPNIYDEIIREMDCAIYHSVRLNILSIHDRIAHVSFNIYAKHTQRYNKGDLLADSESAYISGVYYTNIQNDSVRSFNDPFGWYLCSENIDDYQYDAYLYKTFQEQRINSLRSVANNTSIKIFKKKLNHYADRLEEIADRIPKTKSNALQSGCFSELEIKLLSLT